MGKIPHKRYDMAKADTLPGLFLEQYKKYKNEVSVRKKRYGIWNEYSWEDSYQIVKNIYLGLKSLGLGHGEKCAIIGDNDPEYFWAEIGIQALSGVTVGIYVDAIPQEIKYIAGHSDSKIIFAKDQEQVDKILEIKDDLANLQYVIYWEPKGLWFYQEDFLMSFEDLLERGKEYGQGDSDLFEEAISQLNVDDICVISYTSGTTGLPKGAMISSKYLVRAVRGGLAVADPWTHEDRYLSYVPPAWITEHAFWVMCLLVGASINFPESFETLEENIRELGPTVMSYTPRMWESIMSSNESRIADSSWLKRWAWNLFFPYATKYSEVKEKKGNPGLFLSSMQKIGAVLVMNQIKDKMGFSRVRTAWTGGAPLSPSCFGYFWALGLSIRQMYGATEVIGVTAHISGDIRWDTVGSILPHANVRISEEGEILITAEEIFSGYYKNPESSKEALVDGRWFKTGDSGYLTENNHLLYYDRKKDMITLATGEVYAPQYIEGHLKFSNLIKDVMVTEGKDRTYITALVNIDYESVGKWAEKNRVNYTTYADLSQKDEVLEIIRQQITEVNKRLPPYARIKKFINLPKEFDPDEGELTRTRKLRRSAIYEKYENIIKDMYENKDEAQMEMDIKYRDGRKERYTALMKIVNVSGE